MSSVDILVPDLPESVADATVATWHKKPGDAVVRDEVLVEIETDKVVLEVPASADGILDAVLEEEGTTVTSRQILGRLREGNSAGKETSAKSEEKASTPAQRQQAGVAGRTKQPPAGVAGRTKQRCAQPGDPSPAG
ncbi:Dihydrolipoamide succinyltransferase [Salmonella enterica subsp. enterica serovar Wandsworth str. A4-580]|uniref:Dihydrolipoamide succinyltransferase n=1 Tax=Salmonella enterica subsp. enterica serovar Wandsworth str. A4-580 TaxID=913086 RepID=G5S8M1_SALET|nr:Dihydrolipoamide succinyltransferase [Salmonella enterica subsp. enterica serovar Wandsworth str. A4-580]